MLRVALAASILAALPLLAAPRLLAQGQPPAEIDSTPSDPAAVGFLQTVVDARVYSLESVGALRLQSRVTATFEVTDPLSKEPSTRLELDVGFDYATGAATSKPVVPPTKEQQKVAILATSAAQNVFSLKPSRNASAWRVTFHPEGDQIRLDYLPRNPRGGVVESYSEWHKADGTPLRRRIASRTPKDGVLATIQQEVVFDWEEVGKRVLLKEFKPVEAEGKQLAFRFEYGEVDGLHVLKKLVQEDAGWRLTLLYDTKVERAAKK